MRVRRGAHWAGWADCMRMVNRRHPRWRKRCWIACVQWNVPSCPKLRADVPWRHLAEDVHAVREPKFGWQLKTFRVFHEKFCQKVHLPHLTEPERAMMRSQHGLFASFALTAVPTHRITKIDPQLFRWFCEDVTLITCLTHLPMWPPIFSWPPSRSVLRGLTETNAFVRDMDLAEYNAVDGRRLEIVAGLTLWHGAQFAVDTTVVSPVRRNVTARGCGA